jgi:uncharacterized RDD family membrane protein YckC
VKFDIENEEIEFRPITKGLGFHKEDQRKSFEKKKKVTLSKESSLSNQSSARPPSAIIPASLKNEGNKRSPLPEMELSETFSESTRAPNKTINRKKETKVIHKAGHESRFKAWVIDTFFTLVFSYTLSLIVIKFSFNEFTLINTIKDMSFLVNVSLPLFLFTHLFYHMIGIKAFGQTLGKKIQKYRLSPLAGEVFSIKKTLLMSLFSLINIPFIGTLTLLRIDEFLFQFSADYE